MSNSNLLTIGVFGGSSTGFYPEFREAAISLGEELARRKIALVCGGGEGGLIGLLIDACVSGGGQAVGVMPAAFASDERPNGRLTALHLVGSFHERKSRMLDLSNALIALPGGIGTVDEIFDVYASAKIGLHSKPLGLLNIMGFFDPIEHLLDNMENAKFTKPKHRNLCIFERYPLILIERFQNALSVNL